MTDPISPIRAAAASDAYPPVDQKSAEPAAVQPEAAQPASASPTLARPDSRPAAPRTPPVGAAASPAVPGLPNVHFKFNVDPATHDVTVIMFDPNSHKVLRTIPANELQKLSQGELLELWA